MSEIKHTPTPWKVVKNMSWEDVHGNTPTKDEKNLMGFVGGDGSRICWFGDSSNYYPTEGDEPNEANAAHIVKCVNMHDELVEALKEAGDVIESYHKSTGIDLGDASNMPFYKDTMNTIDETLQKAGAL